MLPVPGKTGPAENRKESKGHWLKITMNEGKDDRLVVYEVGYLVSSSIPEEKLGGEVESIKKIISKAGASIVSEEMPHRQALAYTICRKTVAGSYEKYDEAYFGWIKFEVASNGIEAIKKSIENVPSVIRMLLITTVRENTYVGQHVPQVLSRAGEQEIAVAPGVGATGAVAVTAAPATIEEMDKSIDDMVKEA